MRLGIIVLHEIFRKEEYESFKHSREENYTYTYMDFLRKDWSWAVVKELPCFILALILVRICLICQLFLVIFFLVLHLLKLTPKRVLKYTNPIAVLFLSIPCSTAFLILVGFKKKKYKITWKKLWVNFLFLLCWYNSKLIIKRVVEVYKFFSNWNSGVLDWKTGIKYYVDNFCSSNIRLHEDTLLNGGNN